MSEQDTYRFRRYWLPGMLIITAILIGGGIAQKYWGWIPAW